MRAVTAVSTDAMAPPLQPSRLSSPPLDHPSSSYPSLTAPQSFPLPGRAHSTFIRVVSAHSDAFSVLPVQIPAPRSPQHNTLKHNTMGLPARCSNSPPLSPSSAFNPETINVQILAQAETLLEVLVPADTQQGPRQTPSLPVDNGLLYSHLPQPLAHPPHRLVVGEASTFTAQYLVVIHLQNMVEATPLSRTLENNISSNTIFELVKTYNIHVRHSDVRICARGLPATARTTSLRPNEQGRA
jgi:hypothetical protein